MQLISFADLTNVTSTVFPSRLGQHPNSARAPSGDHSYRCPYFRAPSLESRRRSPLVFAHAFFT